MPTTSSPRRIKLVIAYDGTEFRGWAEQKGQRTVQRTVADAIAQVSGQSAEVVGASRTDSGAHARGQVCHFDSSVDIDPAKWTRILNRVLPPDVAIQASRQVSTQFHSRFSAQDRFYRYRINTTARNPFVSRYAHDHNRPLDLEQMRQAASALVGEHDFVAYTEELDPRVENTRRELYRVAVSQVQGEVRIDIVGTAFLRGMMRRMAGVLLEVGRGARPASDVPKLLTEDRNEMQWPVVLPAKGLCLMQVRYGRRLRDNRAL
jgi:tRNA pseudouridine38-40 synthase